MFSTNIQKYCLIETQQCITKVITLVANMEKLFILCHYLKELHMLHFVITKLNLEEQCIPTEILFD